MSDQLGRITSLEQCSVYIINMFLLARCKDKKISESSTCEVVVSLLACKRILLTERQINRQTQNEKPNIFVKKTLPIIDFYSLAFKSRSVSMRMVNKKRQIFDKNLNFFCFSKVFFLVL